MEATYAYNKKDLLPTIFVASVENTVGRAKLHQKGRTARMPKIYGLEYYYFICFCYANVIGEAPKWILMVDERKNFYEM